MLLSWAYARAEAQHLAPVEYTAFIWAVLFGMIFFFEPVRPLTLIGAAMIVLACYIAARRRPAPVADVEAAIERRLLAAEHVDREGEDAEVEDEGGEAVDGDHVADRLVG